MNSEEIRKRFLEFFEQRGHAVVRSSSLIPDDPSVLLTTAGMQQFKKYYTGEADPMKDFGSLNAVSIQKSFRTSDIDEVGDDTHLTFFEMLGNFSFGGYFKKEAIEYAHDFITKEMGLEISYVTIFKGSDTVPKDTESEAIWKSFGVTDVREEGMDDVFWGPTGTSGPCGPTTELYCKNEAGQDVEIWNIVFNEFLCSGSREQLFAGNAMLVPLEKKGIDTGMGLERLAMLSQKTKNIFETDLFAPIMDIIHTENIEVKRVVADHIRGAIHLLSDGVEPSNKDRGYILRRILRRAIFHVTRIVGEEAKIPLDDQPRLGWDQRTEEILEKLTSKVIDLFPKLILKKNFIWEAVKKEKGKFLDILKSDSALEKVFKKYITLNDHIIPGIEAFGLFSSFGIPIDYIRDRARGVGMDVNIVEFEKEVKKHQELSRAGQEKKFGGHGLLLDTGELKAADEQELKIVTRLHTATHLLQAALRKVLGPEVTQQGSDITAERTRFDFSFPRKLTQEELKQVENIVNEAIARDYTVEFKELPYDEAVQSGALHFFRQKYPSVVKVYSVFDQKTGEIFSQEFCGGPHVTHTGEIGHIKILKEEASSAGIRRIRAAIG